jgi:hypothetical protein
LHDYIKAEQDRAREDRQKEQLDLEHKHKLELIAKGGDGYHNLIKFLHCKQLWLQS